MTWEAAASYGVSRATQRQGVRMALRYGSLFSGVGGLEMGVQTVLGGHTAWHSDIAPGACKVLAHRWPGVPNLGDITAIDWATVPAVDVLTGGFPCQDVSLAGRRAGLIRDGEGRTRSGLWGEMLRAVEELRPALVVAENVRGILSAEADSDVEPCPWCLGDGSGEPAMRALGAALADLACVGYDAWWTGLRASDIGAPHQRFRVFIFATPQNADDAARGERWFATPGQAQGWRARADLGRRSGTPPTDPTSDGWNERRPEPARIVRRPDHAERGAFASTNSPRIGRDRAGRARPRRPGPAHGDISPAHSNGGAVPVEPVDGRERQSQAIPDWDHRTAVATWGPYAEAITRWEHATGQPAPAPTVPSPRGGQRLNPALTEWMMGYPPGHITATPGVTHSEQLQAAGNGVVPQQAAAATKAWLDHLCGDDDEQEGRS